VIEVGTAVRALHRGERSGDRAVVLEGPHSVLVAAIDGLGHGPAAAAAADVAAAVLEQHGANDLVELFSRCHKALASTRGAVMTVARLHVRGEMEWVGVGNVEARLLHPGGDRGATQAPVLFGGVLGGNLGRVPRTSTVPLHRGDLLLMATDGVRPDFATVVPAAAGAQAIADHVLARCHRGNDDALVVAAHWLGGG